MTDNLGTTRWRAILLLVCVGCLSLPRASTAQEEDGGLRIGVSDLKINSEVLTFDLLLEGAFDEGRQDALLKGFATNITYTAELWRSRSLWFDKLELTRTLTLKVTYDLWAEQYIVRFRRDTPERYDTPAEVEEVTTRLDDLNLISADELEPGEEYYIAVRAHLRPMTVEELGELEDWLSGDVPSRGGGGIFSIPSYLARMLLGTTGVTDRSTTAKSDVFTIEPVGAEGGGRKPIS